MGIVESVRGVLGRGRARRPPRRRRLDPRRSAAGTAGDRRLPTRRRGSRSRAPGEIVLPTLAGWSDDEDAAVEAAREWTGTFVDRRYTDGIVDPQARAEDQAARGDGRHRDRVMDISGRDALGMLRTYGESVLPIRRER
jgi:hypothetical protein